MRFKRNKLGMNIGVICSYPVPYGMAATTRIFAYSKGLVENGNNVDVWSIIPTNFAPQYNTRNSGEFNGVSFFYSYKCKRHPNNAIHILECIYSLLILGNRLRKRDRKQKYDALIVSSDNIIILMYMCLCNIYLQKKIVFIFDEYPIPIRKKGKSQIPKWKERIYKIILRNYDGYISMTNRLLDYYTKIQNKPGLVISSITDISRFKNIDKGKNKPNVFKIMYMGNMELSKDNVDNIILAFSLLLQQKQNVLLLLYGKPTPASKNVLNEIILQNGLKEKIIWDYAIYDDIPKILSDADILVSSQPVTTRADGGFPTKLGEYLMSGTPTLLTDVGETSRYFVDGEHMYFSVPQSPIDFADKLKYIIDNYDVALNVADNGKKLIEKNFSHISAGIKIENFIKSL